MMRLPLFPLNTVLFPGMPVSLHIFEERYKGMVRACLDRQQPFGVVLIKEGDEANGPLAIPHVVGCTAEITQVHPLAEGRMNLVAVGRDRFVIRSLDYSAAYLTASVELLPFPTLSDVEVLGHVTSIAERLRPRIRRYLHALGEADDLSIEVDALPTDFKSLAFLASYLLQIPAEEKQQLLASASFVDLFTSLASLYRREVTFLRVMLGRRRQRKAESSFSLN